MRCTNRIWERGGNRVAGVDAVENQHVKMNIQEAQPGNDAFAAVHSAAWPRPLSRQPIAYGFSALGPGGEKNITFIRPMSMVLTVESPLKSAS